VFLNLWFVSVSLIYLVGGFDSFHFLLCASYGMVCKDTYGSSSSPPNAWQKEEKLGDRSVKIKDYIFI